MKKILFLTLDYNEDDYEGIYRQNIEDKENDIHFCVGNLDDCPEDATINRDLFNANDYVRALNKGIELAEKGYTKVEIVKYNKVEEE